MHTVNAIAGNGGSISPSGIVEVEDGGSVTFTITADPGYVLSELKVDGYTAEVSESYTFTNVTGGAHHLRHLPGRSPRDAGAHSQSHA